MSARVPRTPFVLFGLMTVATFVGPFVIFLTIQGGRSPNWPPDRPIEWLVFGLVTGSVVVLIFACLTIGFWCKRGSDRHNPGRGPAPREEL
jgi:uncharacterized membrane protein YedE/YeeE